MEIDNKNKIKKIYIDVLLKDNMLMDYHISPNKRTMPHDYYKDFIYAKYESDDVDKEFKVVWIAVEFEDGDSEKSWSLNDYVFEEIARTYFKRWKIHPKCFGNPFE